MATADADIYLQGGDLAVDRFGDIAVVMSYDEILQFAVNAIATYFGENIYHTEIGNRIYGRRLKITETSANTIIKDCTDAIMQDDRVKEVASMEVSYDPDTVRKTFNVDVKFTLICIDGTPISSLTTISL